MRQTKGLWMQYKLFEQSVYDFTFGKNSFYTGFPLLSTVTCAYLQSHRNLLPHTLNLEGGLSWRKVGSDGLLLIAEGKLRFLKLLPTNTVFSFLYLPEKVIFGSLGLLTDHLRYNAHEDLEKLLLQHFQPGATQVDQTLYDTQKNAPKTADEPFLADSFFKKLTSDQYQALMYVENSEKHVLPTILRKNVWQKEGAIYLKVNKLS